MLRRFAADGAGEFVDVLPRLPTPARGVQRYCFSTFSADDIFTIELLVAAECSSYFRRGEDAFASRFLAIPGGSGLID